MNQFMSINLHYITKSGDWRAFNNDLCLDVFTTDHEDFKLL